MLEELGKSTMRKNGAGVGFEPHHSGDVARNFLLSIFSELNQPFLAGFWVVMVLSFIAARSLLAWFEKPNREFYFLL